MKRSQPLVLRNHHFLKFFSKLTPVKRKKLISRLLKPQVNTISEVCQNLLNNRLRCTTAQLKKLKPGKTVIRALSLKSTPLYKKKKLLQTKRGGALLSVLLPLAVSAISGLIGKLAG